MPRRVLVVGTGLAGSRCAQTLRAEGFDGAITLVGEEPHFPYERPALSKDYLAGRRSDLALQPESRWAEQEISVLRGTRIVELDPVARVARGPAADLEWDALVLATGARPRRLPQLGGPGVHVLRTLADAKRLRIGLEAGRRLAIVGAGFVGAEVASAAVELGLDVTLIDTGRLPFERLLGPELGRLLAARYRAHGVDLRLEAHVTGVRRARSGAIQALVLADGTELASDLVLVAVGAEPASELLHGADGIPTDEAGRTVLPDVYACGDVAIAWQPQRGRHVRLEHWTSVAAQAAAVARTILHRDPGPAPTPYFWSDQFGLRLQHIGSAEGWAHVALDGDEESLAARYLAPDGRLVAALLVNRPHDVAPFRRQLAPELLAA